MTFFEAILGALEADEDIERELIEATDDVIINRLFYSFLA